MYIKIRDNLKKNVFYFILILFFILLLIRYLTNPKTIETFNLGRAISRGVSKATSSIKKGVESTADKARKAAEDAARKVREEAEAAIKLAQMTADVKSQIQNEINDKVGIIKDEIQNVVNDGINTMTSGIQDNLVNQIDTMTTTVASNVNTTMVNKFGSVFAQIGSILKKGIVDPILAFFTGIVQIFVQLFNIIKTVADKIVSLPNCIPFYIFDATSSAIVGFFKNLLPSFMFDFFKNIYNWTLGIFVNWFWNFVGWDDADQRCYNFSIDSEISKMDQVTKDIGNSFKSGFGDINFTQLRF